MPIWRPTTNWKNQDVFIIGGGDSLRNFDWTLLKEERTIGCNDAYKLGVKTCKICMFGDVTWFKENESALTEYAKTGAVFTNANRLYHTRLSWLWTLQRKSTGLSKTKLAWNGNTGAAAVNLALILGAKRVFLLGFDMHLAKDGKANWHSQSNKKADKDVYAKFLEGFMKLSIALKNDVFNCEIINVTDNSDLDLFLKISCQKFWKERRSYV